jgi:hypothetical protein
MQICSSVVDCTRRNDPDGRAAAATKSAIPGFTGEKAFSTREMTSCAS